jgi:hypothetical protein
VGDAVILRQFGRTETAVLYDVNGIVYNIKMLNLAV